MPLGSVTVTTLEQLEGRLQPAEDGIQRQEPDPRCGQLERQRQPVEADADGRDGAGIGVRHAEGRLDRLGTLHEQRHGVGVDEVPGMAADAVSGRPRGGMG